MVQRARIVLLAHDGRSVQEICASLSVDCQVVRRWLKRYGVAGFDGLKEARRSGRPAEIEAQVWQKLATLVVQSPEKFGLPLVRWSVRALEDFVARRHGWRVSRASVSRFLRSMALKPHRVRYWLNPSDPDFDKKAAVICRLYVSPPAGATVLSLDEKPGVQALRRTHRALRYAPANRRGWSSSTSDMGHATSSPRSTSRQATSLPGSPPTEAHRTCSRFLDNLARFYRRGPLIIITDNISTRTGDECANWLAKHPRVRFVFTPKHGSWLNQIEIWFGILTRSALRHASFDGVAALARAINRFTKHWNEVSGHPFEWTYTGKVLKA